MRLSGCPSPKRTFPIGEAEHERADGLVFATAEESLGDILVRSAGKVLLLLDAASYAPFSRFAPAPRVMRLLFDGDALPLFSMPDGVSRVIAAGGRELLIAARYFAGVRGVACTLFPSDCALDGAYDERAELLLGGVNVTAPLGEGEIYCDMDFMRASVAEGVCRILLTRLAEFEAEALTAFGTKRHAEALALPSSEEEAVSLNALARRRERAGDYAGEGTVLRELYARAGESLPSYSAYFALTALYAAFFEKGKPRRYFTPDYRARSGQAGGAPAQIPSAEEYVLRALTLERCRAPFAKKALLLAKRGETEAQLEKWTGALPTGVDASILRRLPEFAPQGLSAVIRDFGLMEWRDDKGRIAQ